MPRSTVFDRDFLRTMALAIFVVTALFIWQGSTGFNLWDEGFLWYGAQRVMLGEVPVRDFMSYDPGRYYWSAALMNLWGSNSIMTLRGVVAIFQGMGLFVGLLLIARATKKQSFLYLLLSAVTLAAWMLPRHKLFDISLSIFLIGVLTFLVQNPSISRYFVTGLCVGLVATFGRNHGVYAVAGSLAVMCWLSIKRTERPELFKCFSSWALGVATGYAPILIMALLVPGFAIGFWDTIRFMFEMKATNIPLPIPWPWRVNFNSISHGDAVRGVLIGLFFIAAVVFGVLAIAWVVWQKVHAKQVSPALVAAASLALPYAHYAYSRADVGHLALGIFPLLVGCLVLLAAQPAKIKWSLALILCTASLWVTHMSHPGWQCLISKQCVDVEISGNILQVDAGTANDIGLLRTLSQQYAPDGQAFITTPFWPGAYALLERKSPMWEIYALLPVSQSFERAEIDRIRKAKPAFALVYDLPLDGRDELRFKNTHPLTQQYILDNFEPLQNLSNPAYQIFKAKVGD